MAYRTTVRLLVLFSFPLTAQAQSPELSKTVQEFVRVQAPKIVLTHVRVIEGTGKPAVEDQNVVIEGGKIAAIQAGADVAATDGTTVLDLRGYSLIPGIVGMHNHLFYIARPNLNSDRKYEQPVLIPQMTFSAPRLYLAGGVTTLRTTGSVETYADLNLKHDIDAGKLPGPHMDVTGPYLEGSQSHFIQMPHVTTPEDARQLVEYWADRGVTSFKAYTNITRTELKAAIEAAHKRGIKVTGHLCSVTYKEAAELGIDDLEHGFFENTELDSDKKPDTCSQSAGRETLARMEPDGAAAKDLIATLIRHHVAITSTLPVFEDLLGGGRPPLRQQALEAMTPQAREDFFLLRQRPPLQHLLPKSIRRCSGSTTWRWSGRLPLLEDCFSPGLILREQATCFPGLVINVRSNYWSKPGFLLSMRSEFRLRMGQFIWGRRKRSALWPLGRTQTWL